MKRYWEMYLKFCNAHGVSIVLSSVWLLFTIPGLLFEQNPAAVCLGVFVLGIMFGIWGRIVQTWIKTLALCFALLTTASSSQAKSTMVEDGLTIALSKAAVDRPATIQSAGVLPSLQTTAAGGVAVVVVVGGTVTVLYIIVRRCVQALTSNTNIQNRNQAIEEASINYLGGSCLADTQDPRLVKLDYQAGLLSISTPDTAPLTGVPYGQRYLGAGEEIMPDRSSIQFDWDTVRIQPADFRYEVERSTDMEHWEPVLTFEQPWETWTLEDTIVDPVMFYRVR